MDMLFENRFSLNKELFLEMRKEAYKVFGKYYRLLALCLAALVIVIGLFALPQGGRDWVVAIAFLLGIFLVFLFFQSYRFTLSRQYRSLQALEGPQLERITRFYADRIEIIVSNGSSVIQNAQITRIRETENLFIFLIERNGFMVSKKDFTVGDEEAFRRFLSEAFPGKAPRDKLFKGL